MGTMILISGKACWGKTSLIKSLAAKMPMSDISYMKFSGEKIDKPEDCYGDILCTGKVLSVNGMEKSVGFSSAGDYAKFIIDALNILTHGHEKELDVFVSACRPRGGTIVTAVNLAKKYGYEVIVASNYHGVDLFSSDDYYAMGCKSVLSSGLDLNDVCADAMVELIKKV